MKEKHYSRYIFFGKQSRRELMSVASVVRSQFGISLQRLHIARNALSHIGRGEKGSRKMIYGSLSRRLLHRNIFVVSVFNGLIFFYQAFSFRRSLNVEIWIHLECCYRRREQVLDVKLKKETLWRRCRSVNDGGLRGRWMAKHDNTETQGGKATRRRLCSSPVKDQSQQLLQTCLFLYLFSYVHEVMECFP